jgi:lipoprotein-anchoring transpeptidase ErfK/SrfK
MASTIDRRAMLAGMAAVLIAPEAAFAAQKKNFVLDPLYEPQQVSLPGYLPGMVIVVPSARFLFLTEPGGKARRYGIGVGRGALTETGPAVIARKAKWPSWKPTPNMIANNPRRYARFAGGMRGGPGNPLGARAMYLYRDGRDTMLRIHGTTEPWTIGQAVSNGCVRMVNDHVIDLYDRVPVGTSVVIV